MPAEPQCLHQGLARLWRRPATPTGFPPCDGLRSSLSLSPPRDFPGSQAQLPPQHHPAMPVGPLLASGQLLPLRTGPRLPLSLLICGDPRISDWVISRA